ncbi:MAG TPA: SDR family NAD(P)-dependent oxidoreductase, partial [candidate division Zixibacteria bacterium]|nr:SDR family NAD(P)-dependent oxidoreductase [candidate division Zixibacteria bacterium]
MSEHTGKRALITGASRGIGAATALTLARAGAAVIINHLGDDSGAARVAEQVRECGSSALIYECDVSDHAAIAAMIADATGAVGDIDYLINNAGITRDAAIWNLSDEAWDEVIAVNLKGCFNTINALAGRFRERKSGRIVNVASINGLRGKFGQANYSAAKAG